MILKALPPAKFILVSSSCGRWASSANLHAEVTRLLSKYYTGKLPRFLRPYRPTYQFVHDEVIITPARISTV